jgi:hypothetical protein
VILDAVLELLHEQLVPSRERRLLLGAADQPVDQHAIEPGRQQIGHERR